MPPYRRHQRWYRRRRNYYTRKRFWNPRRRARTTFQRRKRTYRKYRPKVKRRFFKKKRKYIKIKMFQPKNIVKCKITGYKCLFQGSPYRKQHNWIQYIYSYAKPEMVSGGGWSLLVFSLDSMFEDYQHLQCTWTKGNAGLPLVRYTGAKFKFYQSKYDDYITVYDNCWPMVDTPHTHADSSPSRMFQKIHKTVVPSRQTKQRRKPFKTVHIKPPPQMTNKWYFQKDICKQPLVMLTTTSVDLQQPFQYSTAKNNNITIKYLNPNIFQNNNFQNYPLTEGYSPKSLPTSQTNNTPEKYYLYSDHSNQPIQKNKQWLGQLVPLTNTRHYYAGATLSYIVNSTNDKPNNWGNPFYHEHLDPHTSTIYLCNCNTTTFKTNWNNIPETGNTPNSTTNNIKIFKATENLIYETVYNPENDTGDTNLIYLINNSQETHFQPLPNKDLQFEGFPLYNLFWGWTDFIKKLETTTNLDNNYTIVIQTKTFHEKDKHFCIVDPSFVLGYDPFTPTDTETHTPSYFNSQNWYPKLAFQEETIETICETGPGVSKSKNYLQAICKYTFYFKWGGCPKTLEKAYNPCLQPTWTTPNTIPPRYEIQDPNLPPEANLYYWDWEKDFVTHEAIQRIRDYTFTDEQIFPITGSKSSAKATTPQTKATEEEKEEEKLLLQLNKLRKQRVQLQLLIRMKQQSLL
nr:MAG: ORF1 [TTV-like mini virus]